MVLTLQDMAPLQEQERMWAQFLAMVSHEVRTPPTSVTGSFDCRTPGKEDVGCCYGTIGSFGFQGLMRFSGFGVCQR